MSPSSDMCPHGHYWHTNCDKCGRFVTAPPESFAKAVGGSDVCATCEAHAAHIEELEAALKDIAECGYDSRHASTAASDFKTDIARWALGYEGHEEKPTL